MLTINCKQRYDRLTLANILRAEIILELSKHRKPHSPSAPTLPSSLPSSSSVTATSTLLTKNDLLLYSHEQYLARKRRPQQSYINECMAHINKLLDVYDERQTRWRHLRVLDVRLQWEEDGTRASMIHKVQEISVEGKTSSKEGSIYECSLRNVRYFVSANQERSLPSLTSSSSSSSIPSEESTYMASLTLSPQAIKSEEEKLRTLEHQIAEEIEDHTMKIRTYRKELTNKLHLEYAHELALLKGDIEKEVVEYLSSTSDGKLEFEKVKREIKRGTLQLEKKRRFSISSFSQNSLAASKNSSASGAISLPSEEIILNLTAKKLIDQRLEVEKKDIDASHAIKVEFLETDVSEQKKRLKELKYLRAKEFTHQMAIYKIAVKERRSALLST